MRTFSITNPNHTIQYSKLMFGTTPLVYENPEDAYAHMARYVALGGRTIDTARVYSLFEPTDTRSAEHAIGE